MIRPTIAAGFPKAFLEFAVSRGANRRTLLARSGIRAEELNQPDNRIPLSNYMALMKAGVDLCKEPALALLFGEAVRMENISIVGLITHASDNTNEASQQVSRYARLVVDDDDAGADDPVQFVKDERGFWLKLTSSVYRDNPLLTESAFARMVCGGRHTFEASPELNGQVTPKEIHFTFKEPSYRAEYDRIFRTRLVFESDVNAILGADAMLSAKMPANNPYVFNVMSERAESLLNVLENSKSITGQVERLLVPLLESGDVGIDEIAGKLGVSRQTLFRRLKSEGVSFEKLLDDLRHKLAIYYLNEKNISINQTSYLVGFSGPAAFSRAFKRWTGSSPRSMLTSRE